MNSEDLIIKNIKKDFFSLRNGVIAQTLCKLYPEGKIIYGLNVPQFIDLAKKYPKSLSLGLKLWEDKNYRDSRLFALYLLPPSEIDKDTARKMVMDVESSEIAEFLPFRLLRHLPYAAELCKELSEIKYSDKLVNYCIKMFQKNLDQI